MSDPAVVVVMIMIDLTVTLTASDDVESSANVEWNFQRLFPSMHEQAAIACADCLSFNHKFLFLLVILQFSSQAFSNRSVAKCYGLTGNINLLRIAPHPGESAPRPMTVAVASL